MDRGMDGGIDRDGGGAADPAAPRSHNERLILSLLLREGALPAAELARRTELSKPTVSLILRGFEEDADDDDPHVERQEVTDDADNATQKSATIEHGISPPPLTPRTENGGSNSQHGCTLSDRLLEIGAHTH